jgi:hypothetical protein
MADVRHRQPEENIMNKLIITAVLTALTAAPACAGPLQDAYNRQQVSIGKGLVNGSLTPGEAIRLERRALRIKHEWQFLRATGGGLGPFERMYLGARLAGARGAIFYHKHN